MLLFNNLCKGYEMRMWLSLVLAWHVEGVGINTFGIDVDTNDIHKIGRSSKDKWNKLPLNLPTLLGIQDAPSSVHPLHEAPRWVSVNWPPGHALREQGPRPLTQPQTLPRAPWGQLCFGSPQSQQCSSFIHAQLLWGQYQLLHSLQHQTCCKEPEIQKDSNLDFDNE